MEVTSYSCQQKQLQKLIFCYLFVFIYKTRCFKKITWGACFLGNCYSCLLGNHLYVQLNMPTIVRLRVPPLCFYIDTSCHPYTYVHATYEKKNKHIQMPQANILKFGLFFFNSDTICLCFIMELTR